MRPYRITLPTVPLSTICIVSTFALLAAAALGAPWLAPSASAAPDRAALAQPAPTADAPEPSVFVGTLGAFVQVADACSYYPLTPCGGGAQVQISEQVPGALRPWVGQAVRVEVSYEECGSGIAGQPLTGPVATRVEPLVVECPRAEACDRLQGRVPDAVVQSALANPAGVMGWLQRCNPAVPASPLNGVRHNLTLRNPTVPFHPYYNNLVFRCGCP